MRMAKARMYSGESQQNPWEELDALVQPSVSHTTRPPRGQEKHGREYFFISQREFDEMVLADSFVEYF